MTLSIIRFLNRKKQFDKKKTFKPSEWVQNHIDSLNDKFYQIKKDNYIWGHEEGQKDNLPSNRWLIMPLIILGPALYFLSKSPSSRAKGLLSELMVKFDVDLDGGDVEGGLEERDHLVPPFLLRPPSASAPVRRPPPLHSWNRWRSGVSLKRHFAAASNLTARMTLINRIFLLPNPFQNGRMVDYSWLLSSAFFVEYCNTANLFRQVKDCVLKQLCLLRRFSFTKLLLTRFQKGQVCYAAPYMLQKYNTKNRAKRSKFRRRKSFKVYWTSYIFVYLFFGGVLWLFPYFFLLYCFSFCAFVF